MYAVITNPGDAPFVGKDTGKKLREAQAHEATDRAVRAHLRRGHWHGYWLGPRDGERKFIYKWLPPMVVAGNSN